jgi:cellulose synthase/poly-beta-1,6-N-acetylglucosamine synthase-like glycosyltransferase
MEILFWILLSIIVYTYLGYTVLLLVLYIIKKLIFPAEKPGHEFYEPEVTVVIAAYNERELVAEKVNNLRLLDYPKEKLKCIWVTDGSNDGTPDILRQYPDMVVYHEDARNGKIGAMNRVMDYVTSEITIFCDANNLLVPASVKEVVTCFKDNKVGCVAGEKQIQKLQSDGAVGSGEGFYWRYESLIKKLESNLGSTIGAAGELFAIRTVLFEKVEADTLLDDFIISLRIAQHGYKVKYAPKAIAVEASSANIGEEMKRKIRIAAGGLQSIPRLPKLLNPFSTGLIAIQYWSHKVLRWTLVPYAMLFLLPVNIYLVFVNEYPVYQLLLIFHLLFYVLAFAGYVFRNIKVKFSFLFAPYYLLVMNISIVRGLIRHIKGNQSVNWDKAKRS